MRTVPVVLEIAERVARAGPGRLDRRLHEPRRHRHPRAARRRAPCDRPLQRRHQLPAPAGAAGRRGAAARRRRPGRPQPPDLDPRACASTAGGARRAAGRARRRDRRGRRPARCGCCASSARSRPTTCATSIATTTCSRSSGADAARGRGAGRDRARAARALSRPGARREAGPARAARRRVLQRGGDAARALAGDGRRRRAGGRRAQRRLRSPACRRRRRRGARAHPAGGAEPLPQAPLARSCSASCSTPRRTSGSRSPPRWRPTRSAPAGRCWRTR